MGHVLAKLVMPLQHCTDSVASILQAGSRKRKRKTNSDSDNEEESKVAAQPPKKKRLLTTTQYIYQALFKEQKNSDIAVMALGKVWNLHKVYLSQSPYFYSMFNGSWKESCQNFVHIKILDDRITVDALEAVFGSMYSDEIAVEPKVVISVLATATLFHLDGIIDKCAEVMIETIDEDTAITYYEAACQYGCLNVKKTTFVWLETNLLSIFPKSQKILREISIELMTALISSSDLYVMQTEFSLYTLMRTWIYMRLHPGYDPEDAQQQAMFLQQHQQILETDSTGDDATLALKPCDVIQAFFAQRAKIKRACFLATAEGQAYVKPLQALRTQYLTNHHMDLSTVINDNIIPRQWLHTHVLSHWTSILKVDHHPEDGPQDLDAETFYKHCMRCGRILLEPGYQKWRWTGFNYGLDLILIADSRVLSLRRHHRNEHERLLSLQTKRQFMIRVSISSINRLRQPVFTQKSELTSLCLEKNEEVTLMLMDTKLTHPLLISINLLVVAPTNQSFKEDILKRTDLELNAIPISEIGADCARAGTPINTSNFADPLAGGDASAVRLASPSPSTVRSSVNAESSAVLASLDFL